MMTNIPSGNINVVCGLVFPLTISIGGVSATLNADGSATGDVAAFGTALATLQGPPDASSIMAWLLMRSLNSLST